MILRQPSGSAPDRRPQAWLIAILVTAAICTAAPAFPQPSSAASLDTPLHGSWTGVPLRGWLEQIAKLAGRPVILDRRLDPDLPVTKQCRGESIGAVLAEVATRVDADVVALQSTIRIAPRSVAAACGHAEAARDRDLAALPRRQRDLPQAARAWTWPDGARPADLIAAAAADANLAIVGLETIPHDHVAGRTLPPLTLAERLDLVLADVDKRIAWRPAASGTTPIATIVPLTEGVVPDAAVKPKRGRESSSRLSSPTPRRSSGIRGTNPHGGTSRLPAAGSSGRVALVRRQAGSCRVASAGPGADAVIRWPRPAHRRAACRGSRLSASV